MSERPQFKTSRRMVCSGVAGVAALGWPESAKSADTPLGNNTLQIQDIIWTEVLPSQPEDNRRFAHAYMPGVRAMIVSDPTSPTQFTKFQLSVGAGTLDDPPEFEGLAHLAEHITILAYYDREEMENMEVHGFTARTTTIFEKCVDEQDNSREALRRFSEEAERFAAQLKLAASTNASLSAPIPLIRTEVSRVNDEMVNIMESVRQTDEPMEKIPRLLEWASLHARSTPSSSWSRLGRGDENTLLVGTDAQAQAISEALVRFRTQYFDSDSTLVVTTPVPLYEAAARIGKAFSGFPRIQTRKQKKFLREQFDSKFTAGSRPSLRSALNLASYTKSRSPAFAIQSNQKYSRLSLVWEVDFLDCGLDIRCESWHNPLEIIGRVLSYPHSSSLASMLRQRRLSPLLAEQESIVECEVIDRADYWALWKIDIVLAKGSEQRWTEALSLAAAAVSRIADRGVPRGVVTELKQMTRASQKWFPINFRGQPQPANMALDYWKLVYGSTNLGFPSFEGEVSDLMEVADRVVGRIARQYPAITVWTPNVDQFEKDMDTKTLTLPAPLGSIPGLELVPLKMPPPREARNQFSPLRPSEAWASYTPQPTTFLPRIPNPFVPKTYVMDDKIMDRESTVFSKTGLEVSQLPGCEDYDNFGSLVGRSGFSGAPLARVLGSFADAPFAAALLQLDMAGISDYVETTPESLALWRLTLLEGMRDQIQSAELWSNIRYEVSFNKEGMLLSASGYADSLPKFMSFLVASALNHNPSRARKFELDTMRMVLKKELNLRTMPMQKENTISSDMTKLFKSVNNSRLLLAGNLARDAAARLAFDMSGKLEALPQLSPLKFPPRSSPSKRSEDLGSNIRRWKEVLVTPMQSLDALYAAVRKKQTL